MRARASSPQSTEGGGGDKGRSVCSAVQVNEEHSLSQQLCDCRHEVEVVGRLSRGCVVCSDGVNLVLHSCSRLCFSPRLMYAEGLWTRTRLSLQSN